MWNGCRDEVHPTYFWGIKKLQNDHLECKCIFSLFREGISLTVIIIWIERISHLEAALLCLMRSMQDLNRSRCKCLRSFFYSRWQRWSSERSSHLMLFILNLPCALHSVAGTRHSWNESKNAHSIVSDGAVVFIPPKVMVNIENWRKSATETFV